jgi:osmoprotectant transport system permease protein
MTDVAAPASAHPLSALDKLGVVIAAIAAAGSIASFAAFRANRIVLGEGKSILGSLPAYEAIILSFLLAGAILVALFRTPAVWRLVASFSALLAVLIFIGRAGTYLTPEGDRLARVSPGAGFWLMLFAFGLLCADALTRLRLGPLLRIGVLLVVAAAVGLILYAGTWNDLSILREYANRADAFWREGQQHILLAFGSLFAAAVAGIPLGIVCERAPVLRTAVLNVLNLIQTIPSIALFGLLIAPLAWLAGNVPALAAIGVSGIGAAPALVALFGYSLLPMVANTVVGIDGVPPAASDAAKGMGMTGWQRLLQVELPLAFPVILTGIRIVLVQNIGLATIAALIGGGGFGVFVFQGIGQTAMDLVLLGAVPTVVLAFAAAVVLDAAVEMTAVRRERRAD